MESIQYTILNKFDAGGQNDVYVVIDQFNNKFVSKTYKTYEAAGSWATQKEIIIMQKLSNANAVAGVVQYHGSYSIWNQINQRSEQHIILENCLYGNLQQLAQFTVKFRESEVFVIMKQLMHTLREIHSRNILHLDIKLPNILITFNKENQFDPECGLLPIQFKLADFGIASDVSGLAPHQVLMRSSGTPKYMAPEQFQMRPVSQQNHYKYDVYACGVSLYLLLFKEHPFANNSGVDQLIASDPEFVSKQIKAKNIKASQQLIDVLQGMLAFNPGSRLTVDQVIDSPWFKYQSELLQQPHIAHETKQHLFGRLQYVMNLTRVRINIKKIEANIAKTQSPIIQPANIEYHTPHFA